MLIIILGVLLMTLPVLFTIALVTVVNVYSILAIGLAPKPHASVSLTMQSEVLISEVIYLLNVLSASLDPFICFVKSIHVDIEDVVDTLILNV